MADIQRIDPADRWSEAVVHNGTIYYVGAPEDASAGAYEQTVSTLSQIEAMLSRLGSGKDRILEATIFLNDRADFAEMNRAWDAWVVPGHAPVRCTVQAGLMVEGYRVEIRITAGL